MSRRTISGFDGVVPVARSAQADLRGCGRSSVQKHLADIFDTIKDLNYQLKTLCSRNRDGSYATQHNRLRLLALMADQLHALGYRHLQADRLKPRHVQALVTFWQERYVHISLELQRAFGLRREEAIKFQPAYADQGDHLVLKASWTKGSKAREIPIRTEQQRQVLDRAHRLAGRGSLIPSDRNYIQQLRLYERHTARAGLSRLHGLRHAYAQARYQELTGWLAPAAGGPTSRALTAEQKVLDRQARLTLSRELGHEREQITAVYLGR